MSYTDSKGHRLVMDGGSWVFRGGDGAGGTPYRALSGLWVDKTGRGEVVREARGWKGEAGRWERSHTRGSVTNFEVFDKVFEEFLASRGLAGERRLARGCSLTFGVPLFEPRRARAAMLEFLFESVGVGAVGPRRAAEVSVRGGTGLVLDLGHSAVQVAPVFEHAVLLPAARAVPVGGKIVARFLGQSAGGRRGLPAQLALEEGQGPAFAAAAAIFEPALVGIEASGLAAAVREALEGLEEPLQRKLLRNVVVTGGLSRLPGLSDRVFKELRAELPFHLPLGFSVCSDENFFLNCLARSVGEEGFKSSLVDRKAYEECGSANLVQYLCL